MTFKKFARRMFDTDKKYGEWPHETRFTDLPKDVQKLYLKEARVYAKTKMRPTFT